MLSQKTLDEVILVTKLIFFVMLASKDDISAAMELRDVVGDGSWIQQNKDRNRYPLHIDTFVDSVIKSVTDKLNN